MWYDDYREWLIDCGCEKAVIEEQVEKVKRLVETSNERKKLENFLGQHAKDDFVIMDGLFEWLDFIAPSYGQNKEFYVEKTAEELQIYVRRVCVTIKNDGRVTVFDHDIDRDIAAGRMITYADK